MEFFVLGYKIIHILLLHVDPGGKYFRSESSIQKLTIFRLKQIGEQIIRRMTIFSKLRIEVDMGRKVRVVVCQMKECRFN